jgi:hypothetical protein
MILGEVRIKPIQIGKSYLHLKNTTYIKRCKQFNCDKSLGSPSSVLFY